MIFSDSHTNHLHQYSVSAVFKSSFSIFFSCISGFSLTSSRASILVLGVCYFSGLELFSALEIFFRFFYRNDIIITERLSTQVIVFFLPTYWLFFSPFFKFSSLILTFFLYCRFILHFSNF